jgi:hypothetical protein
MDRAQELISVLLEKEVIERESFAKAQGLCKICGKAALGFRTKRAELEYSISMMCQSCHDYFFSVEQ